MINKLLVILVIALLAGIVYYHVNFVDVCDERTAFRRLNNIHSKQLSRILEKYNHTLNDTSRMNVLAFMVFQDDTDKHEYIPGVYVCRHFVYDFIANATAAGLRCGYVIVKFEDGNNHAVVAFNTTRYGIVFADIQYDTFVDVEIGTKYYDEGARVTGYEIIWNDEFEI